MYLEMFLARYGLVLESKVMSQNQGQKLFQKKVFSQDGSGAAASRQNCASSERASVDAQD